MRSDEAEDQGSLGCISGFFSNTCRYLATDSL
jgi:hypothetical protein